MKQAPISMRRIPFVLSLIVLPLTALVCVWNPSPPQPNGPTATSTPKGSQGAVLVDTPTPTSGAGNPLSRPTATTTANDSDFILEFSREGSVSAGGATLTWGPDTALIPLGLKGGSFAGSYEGTFHGVYSGICSGALTYPLTIDVTATEDGAGGLDFSVRTTMSMSGVRTCAGQGGAISNAPVTFTRAFNLPAKDGASKVFHTPMQGGETADTYTLKKQGP